ncbi:MAG: CocE/NonD family hydrolase [Bacteroidota bacterium]
MKYYLSLLLLLLSCGSILAQSARERLEAIAHIEQKIMMPMRDGIRLCTDVYRPKTDKPVPVIFSRTPYNFNSWRDGEESTRTYERALRAVEHGYAYVIQNERGRFFSEGDWDILGVPLSDAEDAFSWMAEQSWSNGNIGLYGCSSTAEWQMAAASLGHPALKAIVPQGFGAGVGRVGDFMEQGNWYRGGAQQMLFTSWLYSTQHDPLAPKLPNDISQEDLLRLQRFYDMAPEYPSVDWSEGFKHLPVEDIIEAVNGPQGIYEEMITRKPNDPAWYEGGLYHDDMELDVPAFWFVSWYDVSSSPNLALFNHMRENAAADVRDDQYLVIAPTLHCRYTRATENTIVGERSVGDARLNYEEQIYAWFDKWLKPEEEGATPARVQYFTMGSNEWQTAESWPPESALMTTMYLHSEGSANSLYGDGSLSTARPAAGSPSDNYSYDPMNPVPSYGGNVCCTGNAIQGGAFDQRVMETRNDILVYTSEPLEEGMEVSGFVESTLYVSSDAKDTDFTIKIIDVYPDGRAYNLDETIQRARWRDGYEEEVFMEEGEVYAIKMTPMSTSNYFEAGHRIRIEISSSNFPRFTRNLNTGGSNFDETETVVARNSIHHSAAYPSQIRLPVVKR